MIDQAELVNVAVPTWTLWAAAGAAYVFFGVLSGRSVYRNFANHERKEYRKDAPVFGGLAMLAWPVVEAVFAFCVIVYFLCCCIGWVVSAGIITTPTESNKKN